MFGLRNTQLSLRLSIEARDENNAISYINQLPYSDLLGDYNDNSKMPIIHATRYGLPRVVQTLLNKRPDLVNAVGGVSKEYAIHAVGWTDCGGTEQEKIAIAKLLLDRGASINCLDNYKYTALHHACHNGRDQVAWYLFTRGANIYAQDYAGYTPLQRAIEHWGSGPHHYVLDYFDNALRVIESMDRVNADKSSYDSHYNSKYYEKRSVDEQLAAKNREVTEIGQKIAARERDIAVKQSLVQAFDLESDISHLNRKQKAHILLQITLANHYDHEANKIKDIIIKLGFDADYIAANGDNLLDFSLTKNKADLFDLLLDNNLNLAILRQQNTVLKIILNQASDLMLQNMFDRGDITGFKDAVQFAAMNNDTEALTKVFTYREDVLSQQFQFGYNLLQIAIISNSVHAVKTILTVNSDILHNDCNPLPSPTKLAMLGSNQVMLDLLKDFKADFGYELYKAISEDKAILLSKFIKVIPELSEGTIYSDMDLEGLIKNYGGNKAIKRYEDIKDALLTTKFALLTNLAGLDNQDLASDMEQLILQDDGNLSARLLQVVSSLSFANIPEEVNLKQLAFSYGGDDLLNKYAIDNMEMIGLCDNGNNIANNY